MTNEGIEAVLKQLVKAVELLLKEEARRLNDGEHLDVYDEENSGAVLTGDLLTMAKDLRQSLEEAK
jgi:Ca2+-binding EF-hand superfamily protein